MHLVLGPQPLPLPVYTATLDPTFTGECMSASLSARPAIVGTFIWLVVATAVGLTGVLGAVSAGPQLVALTLTVVAVIVSTRVAVVRQSVDALPIQALVGVHIVRFIGIAFLLLGARGELSPLFAERAGWGDVITAAIAAALALVGCASAIPTRVPVHLDILHI